MVYGIIEVPEKKKKGICVFGYSLAQLGLLNKSLVLATSWHIECLYFDSDLNCHRLCQLDRWEGLQQELPI